MSVMVRPVESWTPFSEMKPMSVHDPLYEAVGDVGSAAPTAATKTLPLDATTTSSTLFAMLLPPCLAALWQRVDGQFCLEHEAPTSGIRIGKPLQADGVAAIRHDALWPDAFCAQSVELGLDQRSAVARGFPSALGPIDPDLQPWVIEPLLDIRRAAHT